MNFREIHKKIKQKIRSLTTFFHYTAKNIVIHQKSFLDLHVAQFFTSKTQERKSFRGLQKKLQILKLETQISIIRIFPLNFDVVLAAIILMKQTTKCSQKKVC